MKVLKIKSKDNKTIYGRNDENYFYKKLKLNTSIDYINNLNNHLIILIHLKATQQITHVSYKKTEEIDTVIQRVVANIKRYKESL